MRIVFLFAILLLLCATSFAQQIPDNSASKQAGIDLRLGQSYLKKSRTHKIIGFSLLGAGFAATIGGILIDESYLNSSNDIYYPVGAAIAVIGVSMMATSIPFFIIGAKNKGRAEVLLRDEKIFGRSAGIPKSIHGIGIAIPLARR